MFPPPQKDSVTATNGPQNSTRYEYEYPDSRVVLNWATVLRRTAKLRQISQNQVDSNWMTTSTEYQILLLINVGVKGHDAANLSVHTSRAGNLKWRRLVGCSVSPPFA